MFVQRGGAASNEQLSTLEILASSIGRIPRRSLTFVASGGLLPISQRSERRGKLGLSENLYRLAIWSNQDLTLKVRGKLPQTG